MDYREKTVHGNEGLPIAVYRVGPSHIRYRMNAHWHPEHEILYVERGSLRLFLNNTPMELQSGDVAFISGGTIHSAEPTDCLYHCITVNLPLMLRKSDACMPFADRIRSGAVRIRPYLGGTSVDFAAICRRILDSEARQDEGYPFAVKGEIFTFFGAILSAHLYTDGAETGGNDASIGRMKRAMTYMEEHYAATVRLSDLAALSDMTPNYFCHCFRVAVGLSPMEYLIRYRLTKAQYALSSTDRSITEIALDCGFGDSGYFIRAFRARFGVTPKRYRAQAETQSE